MVPNFTINLRKGWQKMDNSEAVINDLILELSLASSNPIGANGRSYIQASAAASALANRTSEMNKKELRTFEWTILPLLDLLKLDINNPVAAKAAYGLRTLMPSRICMSRYMELDGLMIMSRILDILLTQKINELKVQSDCRSVVEHLAVCYREIARFYQWELVNVGAIRHCVIILRFGDVTLQTIASTTLASLSADLGICKQMFSYGAIKPILTVSDAANTNDACMLAGLGCITQLCRIPEIGVKMVQQGAVPVLEKGVLRVIGHASGAIREKAVYALGFLSAVNEVKSKLCTPNVLRGLRREFERGTMTSRTTVLQILMNLHNRYEGERAFLVSLLEGFFAMLKAGPWNARNLCVRAVTVLFTELEDRLHFVANGLVECVFELVAAKGQDLQEAPLVALLYLCVHPDIPNLLLQRGAAKLAASLLYAEDQVIRELSVILLKALLLYNSYEVERVVPKDKDYLLKRDLYNPQLFGAEYGGMIQEFLQAIVENRREQNYLVRMFSEAEIAALKLTAAELEGYQNTFMEVDAECSGSLDVDELKLLMVLMGEKMDKEEIKELLDQYDTDKSGNLDFKEFVIMMKGWSTRFGTGLTRIYNHSTKRGPIGKSRREFGQWWNRNTLEAAKVAECREKRFAAKDEAKELEVRFLGHEQMRLKRETEVRMREIGFSRSRNYSGKLPPI